MIFHSALLVEDEPRLADTLRISMRRLGIPTRHASTLEQARAELETGSPEFILLDRGLPDGDGLELCRELRSRGFSGLILILTAAGETGDRVLGLNSGADDYLAKPFSWDELSARIHALSRRRPAGSTASARLHAGDAIPAPQSVEAGAAAEAWSRDEKRLRIRGPHGWTDLTPLEFKLASHLMRAEGTIVSRNELLKEVWGFAFLPKTRTVDHFLGRLRRLFEENAEEPRHFLTVRGAGYVFRT